MFFVVFLGSSCRETARNAIKKNRREETTGKKGFFSQLFRPKVFDIDFPQEVFCGVFELPLLRNEQNHHFFFFKYHGTPFSGHLPDIRRLQFSFSLAPLVGLSTPEYPHFEEHSFDKKQAIRPLYGRFIDF
jgi:hypothetical protein